MSAGRRFDVVFCDSCLGGSTVARQLARGHRGLRAFYLADYAINPLGVKTQAQVGATLTRWIETARPLARTLVIACNTASVLYEEMRTSLAAIAPGLRIWSMLDLADVVIGSARGLEGARVCLMGTPFTVGRRAYHERLAAAGAREVVPLAAPVTEHAVALLQHESPEAHRAIDAEIGDVIRSCDAVLLACTCFPLVARQVAAMNPSCLLLDPALGIRDVLPLLDTNGPNLLRLRLTGTALPQATVRRHAGVLLQDWEVAFETANPGIP